MKKHLSYLTKAEKIIVSFLAVLMLISAVRIGRAFYDENTSVLPVKGGVYSEGSVGKIGEINPLFVQYGTITHDLTQLIFSGLSKYDPSTGEITADLAEHEISEDGKQYTFNINKETTWHDGTPVTANDVLFTYESVIKSPFFKGSILNYNDFSGMKLTKIDDYTVKFLLEEPDSFFLVKTLTGLLPEHLLGHLPIDLISSAPFNQFPVGSGPYRLVSTVPMGNYSEVSLEAYEDYYGKKPHIDTIQIKVFDDFKDLLKKLPELDAVRNVPPEFSDKVKQRDNMSLIRYTLPQYVAVFINVQSEKLKQDKVRLALQLGTNKQDLISEMGQTKIIDTPLLEIDQSNWFYQYDVEKANGALYDTEWQLPAKPEEPGEENAESNENITETEDEPEDTEADFITSPNGGRDWKTIDEKVTLTGLAPDKTKVIIVNDYELQKFVPGDTSWSYVASFEFKNLRKGENRFDIYAVDFDDNKYLLDSILVTQGTEDEFLADQLEDAKEKNDMAEALPVRRNKAGEPLVLSLITPKQPESYSKIAAILKKQWGKIGVGLDIKILGHESFQEALLKRDYDLLIFGQNLGYNLDAYPYWHSSQAKEGGYNLSQFKNFVVDSLLDKARYELDSEARKKTLNDIQKIISEEVPAVFLYSPLYYFAVTDKIQNVNIEYMATTSDRFGGISEWYANVERRLADGVNPLTFLSWLVKQF